jgi:DNA mismatch repair protein MutS2
MVKAGIITTKTKVKNLKLVENTPTLITGDKKQKKASDYRAQISHDFKPEIDLRGMTGEEAWGAVDKYLDEAQMHGIKNVSLIHGKGTGALKAALWRFLKGDKRLASFRLGQFGEGDGGVTVVELK